MQGVHPHPPPQQYSNGNYETERNNDKSSMTAAADLIRELDSAFHEMTSLSASAARDAEDARRNARKASEVARRYTARSYAGAGFERSHHAHVEHEKHCTKSETAPRQSDDETHSKEEVDGMNGSRNTGEDEYATHAQQALLAGGRKRKIHVDQKVQSSSERLARSHAEDVLSLSLELERTKQALENERIAHDETRSGLTEARAKNTQLETQIQKLLKDVETQREDHGRQMDRLQQELSRAQMRVEAAEEDAQLALDLAKGNAESREQLETWLQRALQEIEILRGGSYACAVLPTSSDYVETPQYGGQPPRRKPVVRFAESPTIVEMPADDEAFSPRRQTSRSMVAAGRHLLHRATAQSTPDDQKMHAVSRTPEESAERREKLRQRLRSLDRDVDISTPPAQSSIGPAVHDADMTTKAMESCQNVARLLRESGQRVGLAGWDATHKRVDGTHAESVAKQFCYSVEVRTTLATIFQ